MCEVVGDSSHLEYLLKKSLEHCVEGAIVVGAPFEEVEEGIIELAVLNEQVDALLKWEEYVLDGKVSRVIGVVHDREVLDGLIAKALSVHCVAGVLVHAAVVSVD